MKWIVFAVGLLTAVFGVWWSWDGYNIVLVERGWAKHIAGAAIFGSGLVTMAIAALMHKVQQLAVIMAATRQAPRAYAPPPAPQDVGEPEEDMPAPVVPPAPTAASASAIPTGAAAAAVAASLPVVTPEAPEKPAKEEDDDMLAAVGAALAAAPPSAAPQQQPISPPEPQQDSLPEPPPAPPLRPVAPFAPKLPEAREPFVFRPPPPLPRAGEPTLDFSMPPSDHRPSFGRGYGEPLETPPAPTVVDPAPAPAAAEPTHDEPMDAPEVTVAPAPSEAPKLDHLFDDLPPEPPKPVEEPQRRRSSFDWLSTARRRSEPAVAAPESAPEPAPPQPEPEPAEETNNEEPAARYEHAASDADEREAVAQSAEPGAPEPAPDIAEELVDAPVGADEADARLVRRYESQGVKYSLYEDGSIRAESERGVFRFGSLAELRGFLEKGG